MGRAPSDFYIGGLIVTWAAFVAAMIALHALASLDLPRERAGRAVVLAAVFPFSFFFGAVYSEALFFASVVACFWCFRTKRWLLGGLAGALATATRVNGILMWPALAWMVWRRYAGRSAAAEGNRGSTSDERRTWLSSDKLRAIAGLAIVPLGIGMYSLYVYRLSGNPLEWAATIERWGYHPGGSPVAVFWDLGRALALHPYAFLASERLAPYDSLNGLAAFAAIIALPFVWTRLGAAYGLFMAANLWLPLSTGQVEGMGRYVAVMFPLFIWLASVGSERPFTIVAVIFGMLYTLCLALFTNIHPLF
jgi:hypothetical protein